MVPRPRARSRGSTPAFPPSPPSPAAAVTGHRAASFADCRGGRRNGHTAGTRKFGTTGIPGNENSGAADGGPGRTGADGSAGTLGMSARPERHFFGNWLFAFGTWRKWRRGKSGPRWRRRRGSFATPPPVWSSVGGRHGRLRRSDGNGGRRSGGASVDLLSWQSVISLEDCVITTSQGGAGGKGGEGGAGGLGKDGSPGGMGSLGDGS